MSWINLKNQLRIPEAIIVKYVLNFLCHTFFEDDDIDFNDVFWELTTFV